MTLEVQHFVHEPTGSFSYVVWDTQTGAAAIIDAVLDYDHAAGRTSTASAGRIADFVNGKALTVAWILETHAHADHLSAGSTLREMVGGRLATGEGIRAVQQAFCRVYNLTDLEPDGSQFDQLFADGDPIVLGTITGSVIGTPGHTGDSVSFRFEDVVFVGDTLFAPDRGTARADFPGGDARALFRSVQRLLELPDDTRMFLCHDYPDGERSPEHVHTVSVHREHNIHVRGGIDEDTFAAVREARDATLGTPALIIPAVQVNIRGGRLPAPEANGTAYLKVPINVFGRSS